jgi:proteasome lid subunit RPN8/RPN11
VSARRAGNVPGLTARALERIYQHVWSHPDNEVGGVLVGEDLGDGSAIVVGSIPALAATGQRDSITFTHEAWQQIHRRLDHDYPGKHIVGWYHSHPGFGIFFSEHDKFVHRFFFSSPHQIGLVVDPLAGEQGIFGWRDGEVDLVEGVSRTSRTAIGANPSAGGSGVHTIVEADVADEPPRPLRGAPRTPRRPAPRARDPPPVTAYTPLALLLPLLVGLVLGFAGYAVFAGGEDVQEAVAPASERPGGGARPSLRECERLFQRSPGGGGDERRTICEDVIHEARRPNE